MDQPPPPSPPQHPLGLPALCLLVLALIAWWQRPDGQLHLTLLATAGDALVIQSPRGRVVLLDGGSDPATLTLALGQILPFWQRDLHAVILTSGNRQHLAGQVAVLSRYNVTLALAPADLATGGTANEWRRLVQSRAIPVRGLQVGQRLELDGATLSVLASHPGEQGGAVLQLRYGATTALIHTGGSAGDAAALRLAGQRLDLLVYPWQRELEPIAALRPATIVFSPNYAAAAPALLSYADRRRYAGQVFHPKADGSIHLVSDGRVLRVQP